MQFVSVFTLDSRIYIRYIYIRKLEPIFESQNPPVQRKIDQTYIIKIMDITPYFPSLYPGRGNGGGLSLAASPGRSGQGIGPGKQCLLYRAIVHRHTYRSYSRGRSQERGEFREGGETNTNKRFFLQSPLKIRNYICILVINGLLPIVAANGVNLLLLPLNRKSGKHGRVQHWVHERRSCPFILLLFSILRIGVKDLLLLEIVYKLSPLHFIR